MTLGERLKSARKEKKYTQQYMADQLEVAKSTYCGWESNFRKPNVLMIQRIANILDVSGNYLIGSENASSDAQPDILYISRPTGVETTDELRKRLHDLIDQLGDEDLKLLSDITVRFNRNIKE